MCNWILLFIISIFFTFSIGNINAEEQWLIKEEFLSPDLEHFDCHSSNIIETAKGSYCVVWKGGPGTGNCNSNMNQNVGIWLSRFDGHCWSEPNEIISAQKSVCWSPVICKNILGELLLFYRMGPDPRHLVSFLKKSSDEGSHWTNEQILPAGIVGPTKNKPILNLQGVLICPSSSEVGDPQDLFKATACWVEIYDDKVYHWKKIGPLELPHRKFGVIEPALFFDMQGNLKMLCRDRANKVGDRGYIWTASSDDDGVHWSELKQTNLPNPDSGIEVVDLGEGKLVIIYNHSHTNRYPLNIAVSLDGGNNWSKPLLLNQSGESPSAILSTDGYIHVTYALTSSSNRQRRIKHAILNPIKLIKEVLSQSNS